MFRNLSIALMAFLTLVDLFATQAILPTLAQAYRVSPAAMGLAVNASTIGMAIAGLGVALFGRHLDRRLGIFVSLGLAGHSDRRAGRRAGSRPPSPRCASCRGWRCRRRSR